MPAPETLLRYDTVVLGGGAAGVAAARGAADAGAHTLLVERTSVLGGAATLRGVSTYCGLYTNDTSPKRTVTGVASLVTDALGRLGGISPVTVMQPGPTTPIGAVVAVDTAAVEQAMDLVTTRPGLDVLLSTTLLDVETDQRSVSAVRLQHATGRRLRVEAAAFVDASGDAVISAGIGAPALAHATGPLQTATLAVRFTAVDPRLLTANALEKAEADARQAGTPLSGHATAPVVLPSGDVMTLWIDRDLDPTDPREATAALRDARSEAFRWLEVIRRIPGATKTRIQSTGPELGIRQSRRAAVRTPLRDQDLIEGTVTEDAVALCSWPSEDHVGAGRGSRWLEVGGAGAFGIRLDSLRSSAATNLLIAGRIISGDRAAAAAARVMGTAFATGHAAGIAAALGADHDSTLAVRTELLRQHARLTVPDH